MNQYNEFIVTTLMAIGAILILASLSYVFLMINSFRVFKRNRKGWGYIKFKTKPITLVVPAYNEEKNILSSLASFLSLNYEKYEIILVNDGSKDKTVELVLNQYQGLKEIEIKTDKITLSKAKIKKMYHDPKLNLTLIDKENGGKSDALNAGIDFSNFDYFCSVDADSVIDKNAFNRIVEEFNLNPDLIACGATIRVANGGRFKDGKLEKTSLPQKYVELCQELEYTRSFMMGRVGWEFFKSTMIISGAFGVFNKKSILEIDGFDINSVGEDMDLIVRLHKHCISKKMNYKIGFIPDPLCWTEVPDNYQSLSSQRNRWQRGLIASILTDKKLLIHADKHSTSSRFAIPYYILTEIFSPTLEVLSYFLIAFGVWIGIISLKIVALFFLVSVLFSMMISIIGLVYEEKFFSKKLSRIAMIQFIMVSFFENFGYRQFMTYQRLKGIIDFYRKRSGWGKIERKGFETN
jgi:cellulose synthase/poly-beta-1,6-N-acetylglucosamine synthase-like glycosyltransferase